MHTPIHFEILADDQMQQDFIPLYLTMGKSDSFSTSGKSGIYRANLMKIKKINK